MRLIDAEELECLFNGQIEQGVGVIDAVRPLFAGEFHLVGIDDDNVVTTVYVRGKVGFVLAAQQFGNFRTKAAEDLVGSVNYHPFFLCGLLVCRNGLVT